MIFGTLSQTLKTNIFIHGGVDPSKTSRGNHHISINILVMGTFGHPFSFIPCPNDAMTSQEHAADGRKKPNVGV
jgi:hypothetical protein